MTKKKIKIFIDEIFSKPPEKNYAINETDVHHIDIFWSLDNLDLKDYGPENDRGYRYVLVGYYSLLWNTGCIMRYISFNSVNFNFNNIDVVCFVQNSLIKISC